MTGRELDIRFSSEGVRFIKSSLHPEDGGSVNPWNVGIPPQHYTASQRRRTRLFIFRKKKIFLWIPEVKYICPDSGWCNSEQIIHQKVLWEKWSDKNLLLISIIFNVKNILIVKNAWMRGAVPPIPHVFMAWYLIKGRNTLTCTFSGPIC